MSETKNEQVASRLATILQRLNNGETLYVKSLAEEFNVGVRTIQRDLNDRFSFLDWDISETKAYKLNRTQLGVFTESDIRRFSSFASIQQLFPKLDQTYFQDKLIEGLKIKGFEYEDISSKRNDFTALQKAIQSHQTIRFYYTKAGQLEGNEYRLEPYRLLNKNGIWYLMGLSEGKERTFCFSQIKTLIIQNETFEPDLAFIKKIEESDSIYHGNQTSEVVIQASKIAAPYFERRKLLPNQEIIRKLDDGGLLLACRDVNAMEIIPIVQYWIPHLTILSPDGWQGKMEENLRSYLNIK